MLKLLLSNSHSIAGRLFSSLAFLVLISVAAFAQTNAGRVAASTDQNSAAFSSAAPLAKKDALAKSELRQPRRLVPMWTRS